MSTKQAAPHLVREETRHQRKPEKIRQTFTDHWENCQAKARHGGWGRHTWFVKKWRDHQIVDEPDNAISFSVKRSPLTVNMVVQAESVTWRTSLCGCRCHTSCCSGEKRRGIRRDRSKDPELHRGRSNAINSFVMR